jgi:hypothetical protein
MVACLNLADLDMIGVPWGRLHYREGAVSGENCGLELHHQEIVVSKNNLYQRMGEQKGKFRR